MEVEELLLTTCENAHVSFETYRLHQAMSEFEGKAEDICSY
jgi:hypothetical protein